MSQTANTTISIGGEVNLSNLWQSTELQIPATYDHQIRALTTRTSLCNLYPKSIVIIPRIGSENNTLLIPSIKKTKNVGANKQLCQ